MKKNGAAEEFPWFLRRKGMARRHLVLQHIARAYFVYEDEAINDPRRGMIGKSNVLSLDLLLIEGKTQKMRRTRNYFTKRSNFGNRDQKLNVEKFTEFLAVLCQSRVSSTIPSDSLDEEEDEEVYQVRPGVEEDDDECDDTFQKAALQAFKKMTKAVPQNRKKLKEKTLATAN